MTKTTKMKKIPKLKHSKWFLRYSVKYETISPEKVVKTILTGTKLKVNELNIFERNVTMQYLKQTIVGTN